jgi:hypothetical protein
MKYKVLLRDSTSSRSGIASVSFYTRAQATACAQEWVSTFGAISFYAYVWDGSTWTEYAPAP